MEENYQTKLKTFGHPNSTDDVSYLMRLIIKFHFPLTRSSFASFILVAKKVDPPLSGWLLNIALRCAANILSCSDVSLDSFREVTLLT